MKTRMLMLLLTTAGCLSLWGQLNHSHNHYRSGDELLKQQVDYPSSSDGGRNQLWDFSRLKTINQEYSLSYSLPPLEGDSVYVVGNRRFDKDKISPDDLLVAIEHNTMYYYHLSNDSLLQLGHENPTVYLGYDRGLPILRYPFNYGDKTVSSYSSQGLYSGTVDIHTRGEVTTTADAYGTLILPTGDTLSPVLRIKTVQTIQPVNKGGQGLRTQLETCRWYSKGYRYPVFETVKNINMEDGGELFTTAFFFPPQDHLYLDTDLENQALLDELWKETESDKDTVTPAGGKTIKVEDIMSCRMYPNPVESYLNLEYTLKEDARVSFELYSLDGLPVKVIQGQQKRAGTYYETLDCSSLQSRNYVLRIRANNALVNEIIIKK